MRRPCFCTSSLHRRRAPYSSRAAILEHEAPDSAPLPLNFLPFPLSFGAGLPLRLVGRLCFSRCVWRTLPPLPFWALLALPVAHVHTLPSARKVGRFCWASATVAPPWTMSCVFRQLPLSRRLSFRAMFFPQSHSYQSSSSFLHLEAEVLELGSAAAQMSRVVQKTTRMHSRFHCKALTMRFTCKSPATPQR